MPNPLILAAGVSVGGGVLAANTQKRAAADASEAQVQATEMQIAEQRRQFNMIRRLAAPYVQAGNAAQVAQMDLMGLGGVLQRNKAIGDLRKTPEFKAMTAAQQAEALAGVRSDPRYDANRRQRQAIRDIRRGPQFKGIMDAGVDAITSNAAATGGLRGGNAQAAMGQFGAQTLNNLIQQQLSSYGGLAASGQNAAFGVGTAGQNMAAANSAAYGDAGAARAGLSVASGNATAGLISGITGQFGNIMGGIEPPAGATTFGNWGLRF